jgi:hypothetical protein
MLQLKTRKVEDENALRHGRTPFLIGDRQWVIGNRL